MSVYLKSSYAFDEENIYALQIRIDKAAQKIQYQKGATAICSFDEAKHDESDADCLHYLDSEGNFYLTERGVMLLNNMYNNGTNPWEGFDGFLPYLIDGSGAVYVFGETSEKLNEKIYKGIFYNSYTIRFSAKSAAWIIAYQSADWRDCVLKNISLNDINGILAELNEIFSSKDKLTVREADRVLNFIDPFRKKIDDKLIAAAATIFNDRGCNRLNADYEVTPQDKKKAIDVYSKFCKNEPFHAYTYGPIDDLQPKIKPYAVKGFLYALEHDLVELSQWKESYIAFIKGNLKTYVKLANDNPLLLKITLDEKLLSPKDVENILKSAQSSGNHEVLAALLAYQNESPKASSKDPLSDTDPEIKRMIAMEERREEIKDQKGIKGLAFVATGELKNFGTKDEYTGAHNLKDLKAFMEARGAFLRSAVSSKTDFLICNDKSVQTTKLQKALELGVAIITEDEFMKMTE